MKITFTMNPLSKRFHQKSTLSIVFILFFFGLGLAPAFSQTSTEAEPNNSIAEALANGQARIFQPTTLSGTVSSGDEDIWLIGYDFTIDLADPRLWLFFDGQIPAGLTVERGLISNNATPYGGTDLGTNAVFTDCPTFDYTFFSESQYAYLKISSSDGTSRSYSLTILDGPPANTCGFNGGPNDVVMTACNAPGATTLSGITRTGTTTMRLNSFAASSGADGYLVQITDNGTFDNLPNQYDEPFNGAVSTAYGGSGSQVVANVTSPAAIDVTGLTQGNSYSFKVTPYVNCLSLYQMGTAATTAASPTCGVTPNSPTNFITSSANPTSLNFQSFDAAAGGASGYVSYINTINSFVAPTALPTPSTTYNAAGQQAIYAGTSTTPNVTITGSAITAGTTYFIRTYSYEVCDGVFYFDQTGGLTTPQVCGGTPPAPSVLSITGASHSSLNVAAISPVSGAGGYVVMINTTNSFTAPTDGTALPGASTNYTGSGQQVVYAGASASPGVSVTGLDNSNGGVTYYFRAYAYNLCEGNYYFGTTGASATNTTRGAVQTVASDAVFFEVGDTFMDLNSFTGAAGATGYVIKMNTVNTFSPPADGLGSLPVASTNYGGSEQVVYAGISTSPDIRITGLSAATTYFFEIYTYTDVDGLLFYNQTGYNFSQQNVKPAATVTFNDFTVTYGDANFDLAASSNATGAFTYQLVSQSSSGTTLTGSTVGVGDVGTVVFQVTQAADANFNPATVAATMTIDKANPVLSFDPVTVNFGTGDQTLNATAQVVGSAASASTGTISYNIEGVAPGGNILSGANNATWTPGDPGTFTIRASITADANYNAGFTDALFTVSAEATLYFTTASVLNRISGGTESTLFPFSPSQPAFGYSPVGILIINNKIWGVTSAGGANSTGTIYTLNLDGTGFNVEADLPSTASGLSTPEFINGKIWVRATSGGSGQGEIYTIDTDGSNFQTVHTFSATGLNSPFTELVAYNERVFGACINSSSSITDGGIYSLNGDGSGGYVEEFITAADGTRAPFRGLVLHNNKLWYFTIPGVNTNGTILVSYDPVSKTAIVENQGLGSELVDDFIVYNNDFYYTADSRISRVTFPSGSASVFKDLFLEGVGIAGNLSHDGTDFYGVGANSTSYSNSFVYRVSSDGSTYTQLTTGVGQFPGRAYNNIARLDPVLTFDNQTVDHLSVTTLNATSNSTGAITYELISDATASGLSGDQFTAGNVGTVTIRATVAEDANFNSATLDATFTIGKIDPTFTISDLSIPFASAAQTLVPSATNYAGGTITYQFVNGGSLVATGPNTGSTISGNQLTVGNPGTETIRATLPSISNFNAATVDFQLTVESGNADLSGFTDFSREIFQPDVTLSVPTAPGIALQFDLLTSNTGSSLSGTNNEILTIGNVAATETIRVTVTEPNYNATTKDITFTVNKLTPVITWATPADISFAVEPLNTDRLNASANVPGTFVYWLDAATTGTQITPGVTTLPAIGPRTLVAEFAPTDNVNYAATTFNVTINATIVQLEITLDDQAIDFGDADPTFTYTVTNGAILPGHTLFLPITRAGGNTLGTYAITEDATVQSNQTDGESAGLICPFGLCIWGNGTDGTTRNQLSNYNLTVVPGSLTINRVPASNQAVVAIPAEGVCEVTPSVSLSASQAGVDYFLRDDADNRFVQGPVGGTGSAIAFTAETLAASKTYNVIGVPQSDPAYTFQFDNVDGYATIGSGINGQLNANAITVETWTYIPTSDDTDDYTALVTNEVDGLDITYQISINQGKLLTGFLDNTGWKWTSSGVGVDYPKDQWIHIASTYDRNHIRLYINGVEVDAVAETTALPITTSDWRVGRRWDSSLAANFVFGGSLANTRIWNVARSASEISSNMSSVITSTTGLVASYTYTDGTGTMITDQTGNGFSATLQNLPGDATNWIVSPEALEMTNTPTVTINSIQNQTVQIVQPNSTEANVSLAGSQVGVNYSLRNNVDNTVLAGPIVGTGSSIAFATQTITGETTYHVWAESVSGTCTLEMSNTVTAFPKTAIIASNLTFNAPASLVFSNTAKTYTVTPDDGLFPTLPASDIDLTYQGRNGTTYASSATAPTNAGDYTVTASVNASNADYTGSVTNDFSITASSTTISLNLPGINLTYSGVGQGISPSANDVTGNPTLALVTEYSPEGAGTYSTTLPVNAGTYDVRVNLNASETNYSATQVSGTFTIDKAPLTARLDDATIVYGTLGANDAPVTYTGFVNNETAATTLTVNAGWPTVEYFNNSGMGSIHFAAGGPYTGAVRWAAGAASNITSTNYALTFEPGDLTSVTTRPITITADARTITYGDDANAGNTVTFEAYDEANGSGLAPTETNASFTGTTTFAAITEVNAGTYTGVIVPNGGLTNGNYAITFAAGNLTINQATLTVKAQNINRQFGAANPVVSVFEYSGFRVADDGTDGATDISALVGLSGTAVGTINAGATSNANAGTTHVITVEVSALSSTNYSFVADNSGHLTIDPRGVTVTVDAIQAKVYGQSDPATFTFTPVPALETGDSFTGALTRAAGENVGTYAIQQGTLSAGGNYVITFVGDDFSITPRGVTVTVDAGQTKVYGQTDPVAFTYITSPALESGDTFTGALTRVTGEDVNTYAIQQGTLTAGSNYMITFNGDNFGITPRGVTVTVDAGQAKVYGQSDPATFTYTASPALETGDSFTGSLTRVSGENVNTYAIQQGTLTAGGNYAITLNGDDFSITPRGVTVTVDAGQAKVYRQSDPMTFTYTASPALETGDSFSGTLARVSGENVNTYAIQQGTLTAGGNYTMTFNGDDFSITPRGVTVTVDGGQTKVYGQSDPAAFTYTASPALETGDAFTGDLSRAAGENAGTYAITQNTLSAGSNYTLTYVGLNFSITAKPVTVTADASQTKVYGAADPILTYSLTSGALETGDSFTGTLSRASGENVGSYAIAQNTLSAGSNYTLTYVGDNFSITARPITITADAGQSKTYGSSDPTFTYALTGTLVGMDVLSGALDRVAGENAGTYAINQGTLSAGTNYAVSYVSNDFTIDPLALTIMADDWSKIIGGPDPSLTYTITSGTLQFSDAVAGTLTRDAGEAVGTYAITQGSVALSANYNLTFVPGTLTITDKIPQTITFGALSAVTYGDANFDLTATGGVSGNPVTYVSSDVSVATVSGNTITIVGAGSTTITASQAGNSTYAAAADVIQVLTVNQRDITVTADAGQSKVYGDVDPAFTYTTTSGSLVGMDALTGALDRVAGDHVGTYAIGQGTLANANYNITIVSNDFEITTRAITVTVDAGQSKVFGDSDPTFVYTITSGSLVGMDALAGALDRAAGDNVGTYAIGQGTLANTNYSIAFVSNDFEISTRALTVTVDPGQIKMYGDTDPTFTYQLTSGALQGADVFSGALSRATGEDVGTYAIGIGTLTAGSNYSISFVGDNFIVMARPLTITADAAQSKTYGGSDPTFTYTLTGTLVGMDALSGALDRVAGENAGTYAINQGTLSAGSNYALSYLSNDFTIDPITLAILADDKTKIQGATNPVFTYTITSGALINGDQITGALTVPPGAISLGMYPIQRGTLTAGANYTINFTEGTFTITDKLLQSITFDALAAVTYGDAAFTVTATGGASGNTVTYTGDNPMVATVTSTGDVTIVGAGTVNITANQSGDATYADADPVIQTLTVKPAALTITVDNQTMTYGDATLPTLTVSYSGFVNSETESMLTTAPVINTTAMASSNAGNYPITVSGADASNYTITHVDGTLTVDPAALTITADDKSTTYGDAIPTLSLSYSGFVNSEDETVLTTAPTLITTALSTSDAGSYAITVSGAVASNYTITEVNGTLTIGKANLSVTADDQSKTYGAANPSFTLSYVGFIGTDDESVLDTAPSGSSTADATSAVGTYAITASGGVDNNYTFSYSDGTLTVNQASLSVTADDQNKTYGTANPGLTLTYSGFQNGEDATSLTTAPTASTTATSTSSVGSYSITASGGAADNYSFSYTDGTLTVNQATLSVSVDDQSKTYGAENPSLTLTYSGFVNGEDETSLTTTPTASTTANSTSSVGSYSITASGGAADNYTFSYTDGTLTVNQATLSVTADDQSKTYGAANPGLTLTYSGFVNGEDETSLTTAPTASTTATSTSSVGSYSITASGGAADNYTFSYTDGTLIVNQATLSVTADDQSKTYGAANPSLTMTYSGFRNGDDATSLTTVPTASTTATSTSSVGSYSITVSGGASDNYTFSYTDGTLTVNQATLSVTADDQSKTYGAVNPSLTLTYSGFQNGEDVTSLITAPTASTTADATSTVGTYAIIASGGVADNYAFNYKDGTLTINQATLSVTATDQTITFGDGIPTLTFTYAGFRNGEDETVLDTAPTASTNATTTSDAGAYSITASGGVDNNYDFAYTDGTLTINKADQTITFDALADKTVGDAAFDLTATSTSGLTITYTSSDESVATISGSTVTILTAGTTTITASQAGDTNFNSAQEVIQTLTVHTNIQDQTITFEALDNQTYGASPFELAAVASSGLAVSYTSSDASVATVSGHTVTVHGVGTTTLTASQTGNESFTAAQDVTQILTIDPATLTVTADDQTKVYGEANPTLTLTYVGFVDGEDVAVLDTTPTVATTADASSEVGTYEITVAGGSASNYVITPFEGTMTITKATLVATADDQVMRTGDAVPTLTFSYSGFVNGDTEADIDITPSISTIATSASASGLYDILLSGGEDNNYDLTLINGTLTIETVLGLVLEQSQIMIYPNPVVDKLYIDFPQSLSGEVITVQLFDLEGRKLRSKELEGYGIELDVKELPEGILIVQMSANGEVIRKRVKKD